jgi:lariat debranching enzyme
VTEILEAMNHLWEIYYGGWAAPNIYFLGYSGVVNFAGYRIGGVSGIYNAKDYRSGHFERPPFAMHNQVRTAFHTREYEIWKLSQTAEPLDIMMT